MPQKSVNSLNVLRPPLDVPDIAVFSYPDLEATVEGALSDKFAMLDEVFERYDADDEDAVDLRLSHEYLIMAALKLQQADTDEEKELWSKRYTELSIQTFGAPDLDEVGELVRLELRAFRELASKPHKLTNSDVDNLLERYESLGDASSNKIHQAHFEELLIRVKKYLSSRYAQALDNVSDSQSIYTYEHLLKAYERALDNLGWEGWSVTSNQTAQMSVSAAKKTVYIGKNIPQISGKRAKALFAHEVLTHAKRAYEGFKLDRYLGLGLPGYLTSEEGLAVLIEAAFDDGLPHRVIDRYIDIALALGMGSDPPMTRFELFDIALTRTKLRLGLRYQPQDEELLRRLTWQHVNRLYKGTLGNEYVGVFTRDVSYYAGFIRMARYLDRYGVSELPEVLEFCLSGKFDPTNASHRLYVHKKKFKVAARPEDIQL